MEKLKEVFEKAIPAYKDAIENLPDDDWFEYLVDRYLHGGVCAYSEYVSDVDIYREMFSIQSGFWYKIPYDCRTKSEAIDCLQWRVNRMKELLKDWEDKTL